MFFLVPWPGGGSQNPIIEGLPRWTPCAVGYWHSSLGSTEASPLGSAHLPLALRRRGAGHQQDIQITHGQITFRTHQQVPSPSSGQILNGAHDAPGCALPALAQSTSDLPQSNSYLTWPYPLPWVSWYWKRTQPHSAAKGRATLRFTAPSDNRNNPKRQRRFPSVH